VIPIPTAAVADVNTTGETISAGSLFSSNRAYSDGSEVRFLSSQQKRTFKPEQGGIRFSLL
jgi:hypothetical protein